MSSPDQLNVHLIPPALLSMGDMAFYGSLLIDEVQDIEPSALSAAVEVVPSFIDVTGLSVDAQRAVQALVEDMRTLHGIGRTLRLVKGNGVDSGESA